MKNKESTRFSNIIIYRWKFLLIAEIIFLCLFRLSYAEIDVALRWASNAESDLGGYFIYYKTDPNSDYENKYKIQYDGFDPNGNAILTPCNPNDNVSIIPGDPNSVTCEILLPEIIEGIYLFVVTAYDTSYLESGYSNEEHLFFDTNAIEMCDGLDNDCDGELPPDESDSDKDGFMICEGDCDDTSYSGAEIEKFEIGRNKITNFDPSCCSYTSFELLSNFKGLGDIINLHSKDLTQGLIHSTYWFFGKVSGKNIKFFGGPFSEEIDNHYIIDKPN